MAECIHEVLFFGSGDYYLFCKKCNRKWCLMGDGPEYGRDVNGNIIGADPSKCCAPTISGAIRAAPQ